MGKAARRMKKKEEQAKAAETRQENARWEEKLKKQMAAGQYAEAIETLAELVKGNDIKPEFMYDAAYAISWSAITNGPGNGSIIP